MRGIMHRKCRDRRSQILRRTGLFLVVLAVASLPEVLLGMLRSERAIAASLVVGAATFGLVLLFAARRSHLPRRAAASRCR
jgi:hypothetical protein